MCPAMRRSFCSAYVARMTFETGATDKASGGVDRRIAPSSGDVAGGSNCCATMSCLWV